MDPLLYSQSSPDPATFKYCAIRGRRGEPRLYGKISDDERR
jgi:hypothetical protein